MLVVIILHRAEWTDLFPEGASHANLAQSALLRFAFAGAKAGEDGIQGIRDHFNLLMDVNRLVATCLPYLDLNGLKKPGSLGMCLLRCARERLCCMCRVFPSTRAVLLPRLGRV